MPAAATREEVQELFRLGAALVEVLPRAEFAEEHLPGALSLPLKELDRSTAEALPRRGRPLVVYCWDAL